MRGQSEAVGLAVIMALVMGSIILYAFLGGSEPERVNTDAIVADNFAYVLLESSYDTGVCSDRMTRMLDRYLNRIDPCIASRSLTEAEAEANITIAIESFTRDTIERWGLDYSIRIYDEADPSIIHYDVPCPNFGRSGVASYTFGRPERTLEFALCS